MLTKIKDENGFAKFAILLDNHDEFSEIVRLQKAIIWAVKVIANDKEGFGVSWELWELASLLDAIALTEAQADKVNSAAFSA